MDLKRFRLLPTVHFGCDLNDALDVCLAAMASFLHHLDDPVEPGEVETLLVQDSFRHYAWIPDVWPLRGYDAFAPSFPADCPLVTRSDVILQIFTAFSEGENEYWKLEWMFPHTVRLAPVISDWAGSKSFYLRTVIVTAGVHQRFGSTLARLPLTF